MISHSDVSNIPKSKLLQCFLQLDPSESLCFTQCSVTERHRGHYISFASFLSEFVTHSFPKQKIPARAQMARGSFCRGKTVRSRFSLHAISEWLHEWLINESAHGCTLLSHEEGLYTPDVWYTMCL